MGKWGKCDFKQLQQLQKRLEKLDRSDVDQFCEDCAKELAARLLAKVIKRTPVGQYEGEGKNGGTLRRGWTAASEREAELSSTFGGGTGAAAYVKALAVTKKGNVYQIEIINPVSYASYVEFGHRTRGGKGWVNGQFMLTISEDELDSQAPAILERKLMKYLGDAFNA
ncbi:bacteriophage HK97-gp10 putative tail-component [Anaerospora hongkongensis]|uniref:Bacteriophage HK97-gp10 putative tail-component n=1 Tax=Anaerospora hongkongensis TaxID=244830 RepID=A0A4R1PUJ9_9FIRM|nr:HK97 gp10 family phage protein [Anaerospora hongkongensis]TCL35644.1 bacteriophage HK97-gp10 putative tail-component [Anaerospora hongkongensis]